MRKTAVLVLVLLYFVSFVSANTGWEMFGNNVEHSGWGISFAPNYSLYSTTGLVSSNSLAAGSIMSSAIIKNNVAYIDGISAIYIRNLTNGSVASFPHLNGLSSAVSSPAIAKNKYCYLDSKNIFCRYLANNSLAWRYALQENVRFTHSSPVYANGRIWVGSTSSNKRAVSAYIFAFGENGNVVYQITPPNFTIPGFTEYAERSYTPTISGGKVFVPVDYGLTDGSSRLLAFYEDNGSMAWSRFFNIGEGFFGHNIASVSKDKLFISVVDDIGVDQNDDIIALNKNDGSLLWRAEIDRSSHGLSNFFSINFFPVAYAGKIFVVSADFVNFNNSIVYAYNESNGNLVWTSQAIPGFVQASPVIADSMLILSVGENSNIYALSTLNGKVVWSYDPGSVNLYSTPIIVNGTIYLGDDAGNLIVMKAKTSSSGSVTINRSAKTVFNAPEANAVLELGGKDSPLLPVTGSITVTKKIDENSSLSGLQKLSKFLSIRASSAVILALNYIYIKLYYTDDELKSLGLDESQLRMYSLSAGNWNIIAGSGGDANGNFVYANISSTGLLSMSEITPAGPVDIVSVEQEEDTELNIGGGGSLRDSDGDGLEDLKDNCVFASNPSQDDNDLDGIGDSCDNCMLVKNGAQEDTDNDGLGDACDEDDDDDGKVDGSDNCPLVAFAPELDYDNDGVDDGCDRCQLLSKSYVSDSQPPQVLTLQALTDLNNTIGLIRSGRMVNSPVKFNVSLVAGFNLVSLPVNSANNNVQDVLASIEGSYDIVWMPRLDADGLAWDSYNPSKPVFLQSLARINAGQAFWINMLDNRTLSINGEQPVTNTLVLRKGYNMVGLPYLQSRNVSEVFSGVAGDIGNVLGYDAVSRQYSIFIPELPNSMNTLQYLEPGQGYWVNVSSQDATWVFEDGGFAKSSSYPDLYIENPAREMLVSIMSSINAGEEGVLTSWQAGSCDRTGDVTICQHAIAKLEEFKDIMDAQRGLDVSEKAADWMLGCIDSFK